MIHCYTGNGKGKTTAALGLALRAAGYDWNTCVIQFMKGTWDSGELEATKNLSNIDIIPAGKGFYKMEGDEATEEEHQASANQALEIIKERIRSGKYSLIILDEVNVAAHMRLVDIGRIVGLIQGAPKGIHFVLTGRHAPKEFQDLADLVTEMKEVKHPFQKGAQAQEGLDF